MDNPVGRTPTKFFYELFVVATIIFVAVFFLTTFFGFVFKQVKVTQAKSEMRQIRLAIAGLANDTGLWPGHQLAGKVQVGVQESVVWDLSAGEAGLTSTDGKYPRWRGPYIKSIPLDPWGNPYFFDTNYQIDKKSPQLRGVVVGSFGSNGTFNDADDVLRIIARQ